MTPTTWPTFDVVELAEEASMRAGIDFRAADHLRQARTSLELLSVEWANRGLNLWSVEGPTEVLMLPGITRYDLPEDTVDLVDHIIRQEQQGSTQDIPLERWTFAEYATIPNKEAQGRPTIINIRREIQPYFNVWQVPPTSPVYKVVYWRLRRLAPLGDGGTGVPDIPWRFIPAMIAGLAFYLALKAKDKEIAARLPMLKAEYLEQFDLAADEDRDRATFSFVPGGYEFL